MISTLPPTTGGYLADALRLAWGYGKMLMTDIGAEVFAHMPHPKMNHPAFCIGHLGVTSNHALRTLGATDSIVEPAGWGALFNPKVDCVEDDGRYPARDEIIAYYLERYGLLEAMLRQAPDDVFEQENPNEGGLRPMLPTIGAAVNFNVNSHHMLHLGQVSGWRRAMGLGPVLSL